MSSSFALANSAFVLIWGRTLGFAMKAPVLSHPATSKTIRVVCATGIAIAAYSSAPCSSAGGFGELLGFVLELCIGAALGILASVLFDGAYAGGRVLDDYLGIRSAMPMATVAAGAEFGRVWSNAFLGGFLLSGGFERLVIVFMHTFTVLPAGILPDAHDILEYALILPKLLVQAALIIAAPALATVFTVQISLGVLGRIIPKLSTFSVSFPLIYAVALGVTFAALPNLFPLSAHAWFAMPFHSHG